jgi:tetratricopeptide (TPR) repeat protein
MPGDRLENLKRLVAQNPSDPFLLYGLAMEYRRLGELDAAIECFAELIAQNPEYVPAYLQYGQALERAGKTDDAKAAYTNGIAAATRKGDRHASSELGGALDLLGI